MGKYVGCTNYRAISGWAWHRVCKASIYIGSSLRMSYNKIDTTIGLDPHFQCYLGQPFGLYSIVDRKRRKDEALTEKKRVDENTGGTKAMEGNEGSNCTIGILPVPAQIVEIVRCCIEGDCAALRIASLPVAAKNDLVFVNGV